MGKILGQAQVEKSLEVAVELNTPALLVGPTGAGKTSLILQMGKKRKKKVLRFNMTGETTVDNFKGTPKLVNGETPFVDGPLIQAMRHGYWLVVDELNMAIPDVLAVLQSALDDSREVLIEETGEVVKAHPDFRFFGTMNPSDEYPGTKDLNQALLSRFGVIEQVEYPERSTEIRILQNAGLERNVAAKLVDVAIILRRAKRENRSTYTCSTRDLLQWAALIEKMGVQAAFRVTVVNKAGDAKEIVTQTFESIIERWEHYEARTEKLTIEEVEQSRVQLEAAEMQNKRESERLAKWAKELDEKAQKDLKAVKAELRAELRSRMQRALEFVEDAVTE